MTLWVDYSSGRPGGAALAAAGITGALRYVSAGSAGKLITPGEYQDLITHGIQVLLVYELGVHDAEGGYTQGAAHAQAALSTARAYGIPDEVGIAAACDEHLSVAQVPTAVDYVRGFRDVLGQARTGAYGFAEFVDAVHTAGYAGWWWKCGSAPTASESWVSFWQRNAGATTQTINGVVCDLNEQRNPITGAIMTAPTPKNIITDYQVPNPHVAGVSDDLGDLVWENNAKLVDIQDTLASVVTTLAAIQAAQVTETTELTAIEGSLVSAPAVLTGTATVTVNLAPPATPGP